MQTLTETSSESKQITIDVPAARLPEFYAFFGRFLAGGRRRGGGHRHDGCGEHRCGPSRTEQGAGHEAQVPSAGTPGT